MFFVFPKMKRFFEIFLLCSLLAGTGVIETAVADTAPLTYGSHPNYFNVNAASYVFNASATGGSNNYVDLKSGTASEFRISEIWIVQGGVRYSANLTKYNPNIHFLRGGSYFVQAHMENVVLSNGTTDWPGLMEVSFYCQRDRLYIATNFICNNQDWVVAYDALTGESDHVYPARSGFTSCPAVSPTQIGVSLNFLPATTVLPTFTAGTGAQVFPTQQLGLLPTVPTGTVLSRASANTVSFTRDLAAGTTWAAGSTNQLGFMCVPGSDSTAVAAVLSEHTTASQISRTTTRGSAKGFSPSDGVFKIVGSNGSDGSAPGTRTGTTFTINNGTTPRTLLVDQLDVFGGLSGASLLDGNGVPLATPTQNSVNYPEFASHGESGYAHIVYPLPLASKESVTRSGASYYGGATDRDEVLLDSLEPSSDSGANIQQISMNRTEALTVRMHHFFLTDFRKHPVSPYGTSAAAVIDLLRLTKSDGTVIQLIAQNIRLVESGPYLYEEIFDVASPGGEIAGTVRLWGNTPTDMNRFNCEMDVTVNKAVTLASVPDRISVVNYHSFNPMVYRKFAWGASSGTQAFSVAPYNTTTEATVKSNVALKTGSIWAGLFQADNGDGNGHTFSDWAGNPFMVLRDIHFTIGGSDKTPAGNLFSGGDDQYSRDLTIGIYNPPASLAVGDRFRFKATMMTSGDTTTQQELGLSEFAAWGGDGVQATATSGTVISTVPVTVRRAADGGAAFSITGGKNWIPVRILSPQLPLSSFVVYVRQNGGAWHTADTGTAGETWFQSATDPTTGEVSASFGVLLADTGTTDVIILPTPYSFNNTSSASTLNWSDAANYQNPTAPASTGTQALNFFTGQTFTGGTITAVDDFSTGPFQLNVLTLDGTGAATSTATTVALTPSAGSSVNLVTTVGMVPTINLNALVGTGGLTYNVFSPLTLSNDTTVQGSGTATFNFSGVVSGSGGLVKTGSATLTLTGSNTFAGAVDIQGGAIKMNNLNALAGVSSIAVESGGTLLPQLNGTYPNTPVTLNGGEMSFVGNSANRTWPGAITLSGTGATISSYGVGSPMTYYLTGPITGTGGVTFEAEGSTASHSGDFILSAASTYTGTTTLTTSTAQTTVRLSGGANRLPVGTTLTLNGLLSKSVAFAAILDLNGNDQQLASMLVDPASTGTNSIVNNSTTIPATLTVGNAAANSFSGVLGGSTTGNNFGLTKVGTGALTLTGTNTYTGATTIVAGSLVLPNTVNNVAGSTIIDVQSGGTLNITGTAGVTLGASQILRGAGKVSGKIVIGGTHQPGNGGGTQTFTSGVTYAAGSHLVWELLANTVTQGTSAYDKVSVTGTATITSGAKLNLAFNSAGSGVSFDNAFWRQAHSWTVLSATALSGGTFGLDMVSNDPGGRVPANYGTFAVQQASGAVNVTWTPFPPYTAWQNVYFGGPASDTADADGDGLSNLVEYALGTKPTTANNSGVSLATSATGLTINYPQADAATDVTITPMWSNDLKTWSTTGITTTVLSDDGTIKMMQATVPRNGAPQMFMRVQVARP